MPVVAVFSACSSASKDSACVVIDDLVAQPAIRREYASMTNAVYTKPYDVRTYVMSATHSRFGAGALKSRITSGSP